MKILPNTSRCIFQQPQRYTEMDVEWIAIDSSFEGYTLLKKTPLWNNFCGQAPWKSWNVCVKSEVINSWICFTNMPQSKTLKNKKRLALLFDKFLFPSFTHCELWIRLPIDSDLGLIGVDPQFGNKLSVPGI